MLSYGVPATATHNEDSYKARDGSIPVAVRRGFADEDTVEDEITETQLDSTCSTTHLHICNSANSHTYCYY